MIRLGSNVSTLIKLSATERKTFMSKLLDDIGVFLEYYKNINSKMSQVSDIMSHNVDKLKKLNIIDINDTIKHEDEIKDFLELTENEFITTSNELAVLNSKLDQIKNREN